MITVKPGDVVTQNRGDTVLYQLRFEDWDADLERPLDREARITSRATLGEAPNVKALDYVPGSHAIVVRVTSGNGRKRAQCEIMRTVRNKQETRVRKFTVQVMP